MTKHLLSEPISFSLENLNSENGRVLLMKVAIVHASSDFIDVNCLTAVLISDDKMFLIPRCTNHIFKYFTKREDK